MTDDRAISLNAAKDLYCRICMESNLCYRSKETCEDLRLFDKLPSVKPQEPSGDAVSREAVIDIIEDVCPIYGNDYRYILREKINELPSVSHECCEQIKWERDTAIQQLKELGYGFGERIEPQDGDLISRNAVEEITWEEPPYTDALNVLTWVRNKIRELPSVSQLQKGYWINNDNGTMSCSECHTWFSRDCQSKFMNYCGYCGTRMEGNNDGR